MSARKRRRVAQEEEVETPAGSSGLQEATASISPEEGESVASGTEALQCWRLDLLPDDIVLNIMSLLDITSVILLSRVCKRFHQLHGNPAVWRDVDLTYYNKTSDLDNEIVCLKYLGPYTWRVKYYAFLPDVLLQLENGGVPIEDLFAKCPNIRSITLHGCGIKVQAKLDNFCHCLSLKEVLFNACHLPLGWVTKVKPKWPRLTHLSLSNIPNTTNGDLEYFASCQETATSLRVLDLSFSKRVTNEAMRCVCTSMPNLHTLILQGCTGLTEEIMDDIHRLKHLQHLHFETGDLSEPGYFRLLKLFPRLESLRVYLHESVLQSVEHSAATIAYRNSGVDLHVDLLEVWYSGPSWSSSSSSDSDSFFGEIVGSGSSFDSMESLHSYGESDEDHDYWPFQ